MTERILYDNEAFLRWQTVKKELPPCIYKDIVSEGSELRIFLSASSSYELILFSLEDDKSPRDACFLMKTYNQIDFCRVEETDVDRIWDFYGCDTFISSSPVNGSMTEVYSQDMSWGEGWPK